MAQLLLIDTGTYHPPYDEMDDVIGVFDDTHKFSEHELKVFRVISIKGSRVNVQAKLQENVPEQSRIFQDKNTLLWSFKEPKEVKNEKEIWKKNNIWYYLKDKPKHSFTIKDLTTIEKTLLETVDVSSISAAKDTAYAKIINRFEDKVENNEEVPTGITATELSHG